MSEQILAIIEHYKQKDPVGIPGAPVPDPFPIPPVKRTFSLVTTEFTDAHLYGLSKFRIEHIQSNVEQMTVEAALRIDTLDFNGTYTFAPLFSKKTRGFFNATLTRVHFNGKARLVIGRDGRLSASDIDTDITVQDIATNFENVSFMANLMRGIINSMGTFLFESIKPFVLTKINTNVLKMVNEHISALPQRFPNSVPPLDLVIAQGRQRIREMGYDPINLDDEVDSAGMFALKIKESSLAGFSSFHRVGNVTFEALNHTLVIGVNVGTQKLLGKSVWELTVFGRFLRAISVKFTVDYFKVFLNVTQAMDVRNRPRLNDIQMDLGNIQLRCDGAGTADYFMEFAVNLFPNLLRYQLMNGMRDGVKVRVQEFLDENVNLEEIIREKLPEIDAAQEQYLKHEN